MKSILIVESNDSVAEMYAYLFAGSGWRVTWYSDGQRAGEALGGRVHCDAVVVGYRLAGIDGVELITRIRALDHRKDVPIVMVTGTVNVVIVAAALAAGADDVLYKPTDVDILVATVTKCVEQRAGIRTRGGRPRQASRAPRHLLLPALPRGRPRCRARGRARPAAAPDRDRHPGKLRAR